MEHPQNDPKQTETTRNPPNQPTFTMKPTKATHEVGA